MPTTSSPSPRARRSVRRTGQRRRGRGAAPACRIVLGQVLPSLGRTPSRNTKQDFFASFSFPPMLCGAGRRQVGRQRRRTVGRDKRNTRSTSIDRVQFSAFTGRVPIKEAKRSCVLHAWVVPWPCACMQRRMASRPWPRASPRYLPCKRAQSIWPSASRATAPLKKAPGPHAACMEGKNPAEKSLPSARFSNKPSSGKYEYYRCSSIDRHHQSVPENLLAECTVQWGRF
jgi:hypothetical protein